MQFQELQRNFQSLATNKKKRFEKKVEKEPESKLHIYLIMSAVATISVYCSSLTRGANVAVAGVAIRSTLVKSSLKISSAYVLTFCAAT